MTSKNRLNISFGLIWSIAVLLWPWGHPSYVALETYGGLDIPWWFWPLMLLIPSVMIWRARNYRWGVVAFSLGGLMYFLLSAGVLLSAGFGIGPGLGIVAGLGAMRIALDIKAVATYRGRIRFPRPA